MFNSIVVILTSVPNAELAKALSQKLIKTKLAACVQVMPAMQSYYEWDERLEVSNELALMIKTAPENCDKIEQMIKDMHPYDLPEFVILPAQASAEYSAWVQQQTTLPTSI